MSFNRLTIQSLQAQRQRVAYSGGLSGLGDTDSRPSVDYVKAGDVIRVDLIWLRPSGLFANVPALYQGFRQRLSNVFNVIALSPQEYWVSAGGNILVEVQSRGDYARLADVISIVMSNAQAAGLNVDTARTRGEFVSKVETTGGNVPPSIPDPKQTQVESGGSGNSGLGGSGGLDSFINQLTGSPVTLAVILGAAVVLVIAAKK